jgi:hypothetical protein
MRNKIEVKVTKGKKEVKEQAVYRLIQFPSGNLGIVIDGEVFGLISANPTAAFVVDGKGYASGEHDIEYKGNKYHVTVRDLELRFSPQDSENEKAYTELMSRVIVETI